MSKVFLYADQSARHGAGRDCRGRLPEAV